MEIIRSELLEGDLEAMSLTSLLRTQEEEDLSSDCSVFQVFSSMMPITMWESP